MIYAQVGTENRQQLEDELRNAQDAKWYRRLKIVDLSGLGKTVTQLTEWFNLSTNTIRDYIHRYNTAGIEGLKRRYSSGRPLTIQMTKAQWEELLHQSPSSFETLNTGARNWTQALLVTYCAQYLGVSITQARLCQLFKTLGLQWNRGKLKVTSPDPLYTVKRERVNGLKKNACGGINES